MKLSEKITAITAKKKNLLLISAVITVFCSLVVYLYLYFAHGGLYLTSVDDSVLRRIVEGAAGGGETPFSPLPFMVFSNYLYGLILSSAYSVFPYVPWYGIFFVVINLFANFIMLYKFLCLAKNNTIKTLFAVFAYIAVFALNFRYEICLQFNTVAATCCGAAVLYLLTLDINAGKKKKYLIIRS